MIYFTFTDSAFESMYSEAAQMPSRELIVGQDLYDLMDLVDGIDVTFTPVNRQLSFVPDIADPSMPLLVGSDVIDVSNMDADSSEDSPDVMAEFLVFDKERK